MNPKLKIIIILLSASAAGLASFHLTRNNTDEIQPSLQQPMCKWLALSNDQNKLIDDVDSNYQNDVALMYNQYSDQRRQLALLLDQPDSSDSQITAQSNLVIESHNRLIKRIFGHIITVKQYLTPDQYRQLMNLCSNIIRGNVGRGQIYKVVHNNQNIPSNLNPGVKPGSEARGYCRGCSHNSGRGRGMGYGRQKRMRQRSQCGIPQNINFNPEQQQIIKQLDPDYDRRIQQLTLQLQQQYNQFAETLNQNDAAEETLYEKLNALLNVRTQLEQLTADHILLIRTQLTAQQLKILQGLCAHCCRRCNIK